MSLVLYNTLSKQKEEFKPIEEGKVKLYLCGPTVYGLLHIGNFRGPIFFNFARNWMEHIGYKVNFVYNYTDIDDKIIKKANDEGVDSLVISERYIEEFKRDFSRLGLRIHDHNPKVTDFVPEIIEYIQGIIDNGSAYVVDGEVFYSIDLLETYGELSGKKIDELNAGERVDVDNRKKNPGDFVLWKPSDKNDPGWESPWGRGRPGWHLECSVMSEKYLGKNFDIHGGGLDLIFPHHENEIAQSCVYNGTDKFANYWVHNGFVTMNKEKMSKSIGNITTINDATKKYSGQVVRLSLLSAQYKQPLDWNKDLLMEQSKTLDKWYSMYSSEVSENTPECFNDLLDDMNTPLYISKLHELFQQSQNGNSDKKKEFNKACRLIGLFNETIEKRAEYKKSKVKISQDYILKRIKEREKAKKAGNYKLADQIRNDLNKEGIDIKDEKDKTTWKYK